MSESSLVSSYVYLWYICENSIYIIKELICTYICKWPYMYTCISYFTFRNNHTHIHWNQEWLTIMITQSNLCLWLFRIYYCLNVDFFNCIFIVHFHPSKSQQHWFTLVHILRVKHMGFIDTEWRICDINWFLYFQSWVSKPGFTH